MSSKKWDGWEKISRSDLSPGDLARRKEEGHVKKFDISTLKHYDSKKLIHSKVVDYEGVFESKTPLPEICDNCGLDLKKSDVFRLFDPIEKKICRGCYQGPCYCHNCLTPIPSRFFNKDIPYCEDCKKKPTCECCKEKFPPEELQRKPLIKGAYCQNCLKKGRSCLICYKIIPQTKRICGTCASRSFDSNVLQKTIEEVTSFYRDLDPSFLIPIRTNAFQVLPSEVSLSDKRFQEAPLFIEGSSLYLLKATPPSRLHLHLSDYLSRTEIQSWKAIQNNNALKKVMATFLIYLYTSSKKIILLHEEILKSPIAKEKDFILIRELADKEGMKKTYARLKKQFNPQ